MSERASQDHLERLQALRANLGRVLLGKEECIDVLLTALLANGSVLMEDVPGVGKTTLAKALARSLDVSMNRIQFTPDLLPGDILGISVYNPVTGEFVFRKGPIFCNILLADEINRASPRTQSALLEAMNESQATIEGARHVLPTPFLVLATQNPVEFHGTYPLPEAQLDRFLIRLDLGYPSEEAETGILFSQAQSHPLDRLEPVMSGETLTAMQAGVRQVAVSEAVGRYIVGLAHATRNDARLKLGVSPRGALMLFRAAQAAAYCSGRGYVLPDDVQRMARHVLPHRLMLTPKAKYGGLDKAGLVEEVLKCVPVPV